MKPTASQRDALAELEAIATRDAGIGHVTNKGTTGDGDLIVEVDIDTSAITVVDGGLPVADHETFTIVIDRDYPWSPPTALVEHQRFAEHAHVIAGQQLCVFLDPDREWHRTSGMAGFLSALWDFLVEGAAGKFDPATALYHPVGGTVRVSHGTPLAVVRHLDIPASTPLFRLGATVQNPWRVDLANWDGGPDQGPAVGLVPRKRLTYGTGRTVGELFGVIAYPDMRGYDLPPQPPPDSIRYRFAVAAARTESGTPVYFIVAAPNPVVAGSHHVLCGRIPADAADRLRAAARSKGCDRISQADLPNDTPIEWCQVSDERVAAVTRRDARRPVRHLHGLTVELWGCGGLGSWIAELLVRAGVARLVLRDRGRVTGGLLVRQNYIDADIGYPKVVGLMSRLNSLNDTTEIAYAADPISDVASAGKLPACDLLIDATVSNTVLDTLGLAWHGSPRPLLARIATDSASATLGHVVIASSSTQLTPGEIDDEVGRAVCADPKLDRFHTFWQSRRTGELIPAPGCSLPTYHGSAADLAVIAGSMLNVIAPHTRADSSGVHLLAAPSAAGDSPSHRFIQASR